MKHLKIFTVLFMIASTFTFTSCSDDFEPVDPAVNIPGPNDPDPEPEPNPGTFKADFDGGTYTTSTTTAYVSGGVIIINALRAQGDSFSILLQGSTVGTYDANDNLIVYQPVNTEYGYAGNHPTDENANTGSIIITEIDAVNQTISGTFSFTGYWTDDTVTVAPKQFTNGVFTDLPFTTSAPTDDTFFAKIDGVDFVQTLIATADTEINNLSFLSIAAQDATQQSITVSVRPTLTVGEYLITGNTTLDVVQVNYKPAGADFGTAAQSGFVTIVQKTPTRIKGTFGATVTIEGTTYQITTGSFDVAY